MEKENIVPVKPLRKNIKFMNLNLHKNKTKLNILTTAS